jgi:hypothetical protein
LERVDFENSLHLGEETVQQAEVAAGDADKKRAKFYAR